MYRYRHDGSTHTTLIAMKRHLHKVGRLRYIRGYRYRGRYGVTHEAVLVVGTKGSCRLGGFLWGYSGTGPRGLVELLQFLSVNKEDAERIAFQTKRRGTYDVGDDWRIDFNTEYQVKVAA